MEALARWPHPDGQVLPVEFIPVMEQTGLIRPFTQWVLETALRQLSEWRRSGFAVSMAVNLSPTSLRDPAFPALLTELMHKWEVDGDLLILELTEKAFLYDSEHTLETLRRLHSVGVKLSIDDFGTGFSSLGYLQKLPVSEIKIDRSFVQNMTTDKDHAIIVHSTIDLAHNLGLGVVAEGVESQAAAGHLRDLRCDSAQGYYLGHAQPAWECFQYLRTAVAN